MFGTGPESCKAVMAHRLIRQRRCLAGLSLAFSATLLAGCSTPTRCGGGSWAGRRPSLDDYVTGRGATDGATAAGAC